MRRTRSRRTVRCEDPVAEGAGHGQGQAQARGQEAQEEQGQEGRSLDRGHAPDERHPAQLRLFVAVRPPEAALTHLATALGREVDPRWHLTLAFLGEQPDPRAFDLTEVATGVRPFPLALSGATQLGRIVGTGVRGDTRALAGVARRVQEVCRDAGAELERRRWRPHLTLSRDGEVPAALWAYDGPAWPVTEVELIRSVLGHRAEHTVVQSFRLG